MSYRHLSLRDLVKGLEGKVGKTTLYAFLGGRSSGGINSKLLEHIFEYLKLTVKHPTWFEAKRLIRSDHQPK